MNERVDTRALYGLLQIGHCNIPVIYAQLMQLPQK
jgi:hypothetical protein